MDSLINALNWIAVNVPWNAILAAGILSPVMAGVSKLLRAKKGLTKFLIFATGASVVATANVLLNMPSADPTVIATQTAVLGFLAQPFYLAMVKPFMQWFAGELAKAAAYDNEIKSAAVPAEGLPIAPAPLVTPPVEQDFSH